MKATESRIAKYSTDAGHKGFTEMFEATVKRRRSAVAVVSGDQRFTYEELNAVSDRVASGLRCMNVGPGSLIAVCVERSANMIVGILGILKAGAAYVPIDPGYPRERIEFMLTDSNASIILIEERFAEQFSGNSGLVVTIDRCIELADENKEDLDPKPQIEAEDLAYVIYTSGSTGTPKGVMISHGNLVNYVMTLPLALGVSESDRYLHTASISFSSSVRQMMVPLSIGATMVVATAEQVREPLSLLDLIRRENVTVVDLVPSFWRSTLLSLQGTSETKKQRLVDNNLRLLLSASEPLPEATARSIIETFSSNACLINMYGQTETTGIVTVGQVRMVEIAESRTALIGCPIANATAYIVDADMEPVPVGQSGELCIGGPGVGQGYLNQPELTSDRFVANPFEVGSSLYKTGDTARFRPDGVIEFIGRLDSQVKIRGFRVELGEIETVIGGYSGIADSLVVARNGSSTDKRLIAYVSSVGGSVINIPELRDYLRAKLPSYMVPSAIIELEQFPLTPNGKIDRPALPEPENSGSFERADYIAARTKTEKTLLRIWTEVLGITNIGIDDSFFDLGGDSLLAISMFAAVEKTFDKSIPIATLFGAATIAKLAEIVDKEGWSAPESSIVPIKPDGKHPPFFCVHAGGGNVLFYNDLARHLSDDIAIYGVRAMRLGGRQVGHASIEEMARFYVDEIQAVQPTGPYFLGGHSLGGMIALEVAQQLNSSGFEVGMLAMFDTWGPGYPRRLTSVSNIRRKVYDIAHRLSKHGDRLLELNLRNKVAYLAGICDKVYIRARRRCHYGYKSVVRKLYKTLEKPIPHDYIQIKDQIHRAARGYGPKAYSGPVTFFRAEFQPRGVLSDPLLGWDGILTGGLTVYDVPGDHITLMKEPNIRVLADKFESSMLPIFEKMPHLEGKTVNASSVSKTA